MNRLRIALDRHWFGPASLRELALVRVVLVAAQLVFFLPDLDDQLWLARAADDYFVPIPMHRIAMLPFAPFGIERLGPMLVAIIWSFAVATGISALVGFWARTSLFAFTSANVLLISHAYSFLPTHHPEALMMLALGILSFAPVGDALSIDDLRRRRRAMRVQRQLEPAKPREDLSPFARWPLRTIQWLLALVYLSAAVSKARNGGAEWFHPATLQHTLVRDGLINEVSAGGALAAFPLLIAVLAVGAFALEATFWVPIVAPRLTWHYVLAGVALHSGIWWAQGVKFGQFLVIYVVFIEALRKNLPKWSTRSVAVERVGRLPRMLSRALARADRVWRLRRSIEPR